MSVADRLITLFQPGERTSSNIAAAALQRSLMPDVLPRIAGFELAGSYLPAEDDLGGDWYDVFLLPDGRVGFVMGDVMGHGFNAALIMGRLRSSLRSYALDHDDPAEVLHRLDRKIEHFEPGAMATVVYGVSAPPFDTVRLSSAGHLTPVLALAGGVGRFADVPPDLPLGADSTQPRRSTDIDLPRGAMLCLFTDGLVEQHPDAGTAGTSIDDQLERVCAAVTGTGTAEAAIRGVIACLADPGNLRDDVAVLVINRLHGEGG